MVKYANIINFHDILLIFAFVNEVYYGNSGIEHAFR